MSSSVESQLELSPEKQITAMVTSHEFFAPDRAVWVARAPGRLDVMGGNVDYTGGMVLQSLLREAVWVAVQPRGDGIIRILNPGAAQFGWEPRLEVRSSDLRDPATLRHICSRHEGTRWSSYVLGALYFLKKRRGLHRIREDESSGGANLFIASDLPPNRGISSSAALEVATLKAASSAWGISLDGVALAMAGQWVENVVVGAACGIMDQAAIVLGEENHLLPLLCQPCVPAPAVVLPAGIHIWGIDSMTPRSTASSAYETARAAAFMGYKLICRYERVGVVPDDLSEIPRWTDSRWKGYLSNLSPSEFRSKFERRLPESLSGREFLRRAGEHADPFSTVDPAIEYPVCAAVRYAVEENLRVRMVHTLLKGGAAGISNSSLQLAGELLCQSHAAYTECGLGSQACDDLVSRTLGAGFPGAKMTGGGAGGVVAILGRAEDRHAIHRVAQEYAAQQGAMPHIFEGSSGGVDAFGVRVWKPSPQETPVRVARGGQNATFDPELRDPGLGDPGLIGASLNG